ncbi:MAG TPA: TlpA disulfide reductase family protein [Actinomycetota bacterium]|nr:TlpA disulfide reductase family protein [Actinomycetota bacterium]
MRSPQARLSVIGLVAVGVLASLWIVAARRPQETGREPVELSGRVPSIDAPAVVGNDRVTPELYSGKTLVVNFWASWCGPCRREQPGLEALWREYRDRGVQFVGVDFKDDAAAAREFVREFDVTYPSARDPSGAIGADFAIPYVPTTVLADADGELRWLLPGEQHPEQLREYLEALLAEG